MVLTMQEPLTVKDAIQSRHSIRKFKQEAIPKENIEQIVKLTGLAPSAWNLQPWRIHVVNNSEMREKLQEAAYGQQQVTSAPSVAIIASDMEDVLANLPKTVHPSLPEERKQEEVANLAAIFGGMSEEERGQWGLTQTNIALGFFLITLESFGYASVPMLGFDQEKVKEILGLPTHVKFAAMVPFGKADSEGYEHHRLPIDDIVTYH